MSQILGVARTQKLERMLKYVSFEYGHDDEVDHRNEFIEVSFRMSGKGKVLVVAGSDSSGGAGIQVDIQAITAQGALAATAITALTAQNTREVADIFEIPVEFVIQQIAAVLTDISIDVIKTGMLLSAKIITAVADNLPAKIPLIIDPVMKSTSGKNLLHTGALEVLKKRLIPKSFLLTPNIPEAEILIDEKITTVEDMVAAAKYILANMGTQAVLLKGGHLSGDILTDVLVSDKGISLFNSKRINSGNNRGTGCALASAIAAYLAQGIPLLEAVGKAREYVKTRLRQAIL